MNIIMRLRHILTRTIPTSIISTGIRWPQCQPDRRTHLLQELTCPGVAAPGARVSGATAFFALRRCDDRHRPMPANVRHRVRVQTILDVQISRRQRPRREPVTGLYGRRPPSQSRALSKATTVEQIHHIGPSSAFRIRLQGRSSRNGSFFTEESGYRDCTVDGTGACRQVRVRRLSLKMARAAPAT